MNKNKAIIVTAVMAAMLVTIMIGLYLLKAIMPLLIIAGTLSGIGIYKSCTAVCAWLCEKPTERLAPVLPSEESFDTGLESVLSDFGA